MNICYISVSGDGGVMHKRWVTLCVTVGSTDRQ